MHWSDSLTSISRVIFPQHNHHQSQLQYTQDTCKALSSPRNSPSITYMASLSNLSFSFCSNLSLHHATTLLHPSCFQATLHPTPPPLTTTASFPSLPSNCIPHAIQATPLFSNFHHCLSQFSIIPLFLPLYVGVALYQCMTDYNFTLSSRTLSSNISAPIVVGAWHFPSPAKCPFCYPFWLNLACSYTASFTFPTFHSHFPITLGMIAAEHHNVHLSTTIASSLLHNLPLFWLKFFSSCMSDQLCVCV